MPWKRALGGVLVLAAIAYPLLVYLALEDVGARPIAVLLMGAVIIRFWLAKDRRALHQILLPAIALPLCLFALAQENTLAIKLYPVVINWVMSLSFALSLWSEQTLIESMAARFTDLNQEPPEARRYMRKLTVVWAILLAANGLVAGYTACCTSDATWALYNGFLAYLVMGTVMLVELIVRYFFKRSLQKRHKSEILSQ